MELKRMFAFMVVFLLGAVALASGLSLMTADAGSTYNNPPDPPVIAGPTSGSINVEYTYNITLNDPDGDQMKKLEVDFGDENISLYECGCTDPPWLSGTTIYISHKWKESGNYAVKARVMDIYWEWSDWSTLEVSMPKTYHGIWSFMEKINGWFTSITGRSMMPVWGK